ncbi:MAG: aldolase, partial [Terracoccus sp.]
FPKVSTVSQVEAMVSVCAALESAHALDQGALGFEIQVETPQLILGPDGSAPVATAIHVAGGRVTSLHYGTYDYSASLQIAAEYQASDHPAADHAKTVMQLAAAGTGVHLSDGSTNVLPVGPPEQVRSAWALHAGLVERALRRGYYQGWDLHFGQLPTRYLTTFAFYRSGFDRAATRLANYVSKTDSAIMDEPATARALSRFLQRGHACGAIDESELVATTGLDAAAIGALARPHSDTESLRASA